MWTGSSYLQRVAVTRSREGREEVASPLRVRFEVLFRRCAQAMARWRSTEWYNDKANACDFACEEDLVDLEKSTRCGPSRKS
jgi:hypothetical protein